MLVSKNIFSEIRSINGRIYVSLNNDVFLLDETGYEIWKIITDDIDLKDLILEVSKIYNVDYDFISEDIKGFISSLSELNLVEIK
ncbi:PqqD family protein [Bacillus salitolerans]|uniref:PqqD family protein n=1 Tax=Bacillus salitolerans TaxID=1437434 RepID=A0ABW4LKW8_9BACI